jgi:hypothetical protein
VSVAAWEHGQSAAFDVTVVSPFIQTVLSQAAQQRGHAASKAEQHKDAKSLELCAAQGILFVPLAVEVLGGWGQIALNTFKRLARMLSERTGRSRSEETTYLYQRLSVSLQRDNARMIQQRAPVTVGSSVT